jgi:hypothetical protein
VPNPTVALVVDVALEEIFVAFEAVSVALFVIVVVPSVKLVSTVTWNVAVSVVSPCGIKAREITIRAGEAANDAPVPVTELATYVTVEGSVSRMLTVLAESVPISPYLIV